MRDKPRAPVPAPTNLEARAASNTGTGVVIVFPAVRAAGQLDYRREVEALYRDKNPALVALLRRRLGNEADAQEAAQEAYIRLLQQNRPDRPSLLQAYLFRIAFNIATDVLRRRRCGSRVHAQVMFEEEMEPDQESGMMAQESLDAAQAAFAGLPAHCRTAFALNRHSHWSTVQIAARLGVSDRTVRRYLILVEQTLTAAVSGGTPVVFAAE